MIALFPNIVVSADKSAINLIENPLYVISSFVLFLSFSFSLHFYSLLIMCLDVELLQFKCISLSFSEVYIDVSYQILDTFSYQFFKYFFLLSLLSLCVADILDTLQVSEIMIIFVHSFIFLFLRFSLPLSLPIQICQSPSSDFLNFFYFTLQHQVVVVMAIYVKKCSQNIFLPFYQDIFDTN